MQIDFVGRASNSNHYRFRHTYLKVRFNFRIVSVIADGNCFFRVLSHSIFGNESEHNKVRVSFINTFELSLYVEYNFSYPNMMGPEGVWMSQMFG